MKLEIVFKDERKEIFDGVESLKLTEKETTRKECYMFETALTPTDGKRFLIIPSEIDRSIFEKPREDEREEMLRQLIQEAFIEVDNHPEEYDISFFTLIPELKEVGCKTIREMEEYAKDLGGQMANWVEQTLEWAQRIFNGESWKNICSRGNRTLYYRMVRWKDGRVRFVGHSYAYEDNYPSFYVYLSDFDFNNRMPYTVPLVVLKD